MTTIKFERYARGCWRVLVDGEHRATIRQLNQRLKHDVPTGRKLGDGSHVFFDTVSTTLRSLSGSADRSSNCRVTIGSGSPRRRKPELEKAGVAAPAFFRIQKRRPTMLCDELVLAGRVLNPLIEPGSMNAFTQKIAAATKYDLSEDFASAADGLSADLRQLSRALAFCRLPYPVTWIEVAQSHRQHFVNGLPIKEWQGSPQRIGFLLTAIRKDLSAFKAHLLWSFRDGTYNAALFALEFDYVNVTPDEREVQPGPDASLLWRKAPPEVRRALSRVVNVVPTDYHLHDYSAAFSEQILQMGAADWGGEHLFINAMLALMNARNTSETEYIDNAQLNRKRDRRGQRTLSSHHVLKIHPRQRKRIRADRGNGRTAELRAHFVSGHWKVRKTGIFYWMPFTRGNPRKGAIDKSYYVA